MGDDVALDGTGGDQHAQLRPGVTVNNIVLDHPSRADMIDPFFNTGAFVPTNQVPRGTYGNAGRGLISGPAFNAPTWRDEGFPFPEQLRLQLRGEAFNAFNQVNFGNPVTNVSSSAFGRIRSAGDPRIMQIALKLIW